jgi:TRAP-type C4-dicarboxylate transport system substrate-binding protein
MSKRVYDGFTPEEQTLVRKLAKDSVTYMRQLWDAMETTSQDKVKAAGVEVIPIDKAPFEAAMKPIYDQFVTDPALKDMITTIKAGK